MMRRENCCRVEKISKLCKVNENDEDSEAEGIDDDDDGHPIVLIRRRNGVSADKNVVFMQWQGVQPRAKKSVKFAENHSSNTYEPDLSGDVTCLDGSSSSDDQGEVLENVEDVLDSSQGDDEALMEVHLTIVMSQPEQPQTPRFCIGYALHPQKIQNLIQPSLLYYTKQHGIDLLHIDLTIPLINQGSFHCIIHKLYSHDWNKLHLHEYLEKYPNTLIMDHPHLVEQLHNRVSMLEPMTHLEISPGNYTVGVPKQLVADDNSAMEEMGLSLRFPIIAKPLFSDGTASSHELCLIFDREGLRTLNNQNNNNSGIVLQEFVNHGGVVFKVYVAGEHVRCVKRKSLLDISEGKLRTLKGLVKFSQISNSRVEERSENRTENVIEKAEMPPEELVMELGRGLREAMGLNLFNVDVIRDANDYNKYLVIDINYFPGYTKLPCYEPFITAFLLDSIRNKTA
ncbi:unnamed protein product [Lupinus luteus]|uniref:ATP-grasp domain-containing protein n=1 Tax=Lupinus luteus TaxID=3873 RepID=A0AAV1XEG3_LUPLU